MKNVVPTRSIAVNALKLLCAAALLVTAFVPPGQAQSTLVARVKPYRVSSSLREVGNFKVVSKAIPISAEQKGLIAKNLFAVAPTKSQQLFHIYEQNDYKNVPSFVTVDSVLQLYHIFYDYALRTVEAQSLMPVLKKLTSGMLHESIEVWNQSEDPQLKAAALKNVAYFGVSDRLLGQKTDLPEAAKSLVAREMSTINAQQGFEKSAIFPYRVDYSQFIARGHYTRSATLKQFFRGMMWFGLVPFAMTADGTRADEPVRQALLWVKSLYRTGLAEEWNTIYEPTSFFVGSADDLTPREWKTLSDRIFGATSDYSAFADTAKYQKFYAAARKLRRPRIGPKFGRQMGLKNLPNMIPGPLPAGAQLRFMGQRYIPDSEILQRLSTPVQRVFPSGLDVMGVLGSARAKSILDAHPQIFNAGGWKDYRPERTRLTAQFAQLPRATWNSNLYYGWLYGLKALLEPVATGYPSFMKSSAWGDKSLNSALGSWAELRHDTILYGKQSAVEMGGGEDAVPFVKGYVEPNLPFYDRLLNLTSQSRQGLTRRKLMPAELREKWSNFEDLLRLLKRLSTKQLLNQKLTKEEYEEIRYIGGRLEYMTLSVMTGGANSWELVSQTDKNMAVVADVHTGAGMALEVGVGYAQEMWVVVPIEGKLSLARGALFSFYEFKQPASQRLSDEKWQALLKTKRAPAAPSWTKSFRAPGKAREINTSEFPD